MTHIPHRLQKALDHLYTAFHGGTLNPECCKQCAVGNILNQTDTWKHFSDEHGSLKLNYIGLVNQNLGKTFNGYTPLELLHIEATFLKACGFEIPLHHANKKPKKPRNKAVLFEGLSAVIELLCELDQVPNVLNIKKLFEIEKDQMNPECV